MDDDEAMKLALDEARAALEQARRRWGIRWTLLNPQERLVKKLDADPQWRRIYADPYAVVHVRRR